LRERWTAHRVALIYILFSAIWIIASDRFVSWLFPSYATQAVVQTIKGLFFVTVSALLVFVLVRRDELQLQRSELRLRALFDSSPDALILCDDEGRVLDANASAVDMLGHTTGELRGLSVFDLSAADLREDAEHKLARALDGKIRFEWRLARRDGSTIDAEVSSRPVELDGRRSVLSSVRDISGRKQLERDFQLLFETMFDAFALHEVVCNDEGEAVDTRFLTVNPAFERMTGLKAETVIGRTVREVLPGTEDVWIDHFARAAMTGEPAHIVDFHAELDRWYEVSIYSPAPRHAAVVFMDVSDRRRAEAARRAHEERLQLALAGAELGMWDWHAGSDAVSFDERWAGMLGYDLAEIEPTRAFWESLIHPDDRERAIGALEAHVAGRTPNYEVEHRLRHKSGDWIWVLSKGKVLARDAGGQAQRMAGTHLDITARKAAEAERAQLEVQLRQAQKMEAVGQLAGGVAHDFNNLLQVINGYAEMALTDLDPEHLAHGSVSEITRAGQRAASLVSQLLAFSRRQIMEPAHVDLNEVVAGLLKMLDRIIGEHIDLSFLPSRDLGTILADRGMLEQVLMNLCLNARDAMPGGGTLTIETENVRIDRDYAETHAWAQAGRYVLMTVTDTGTGMDAATLERIFEPFYSTKEPGRGTGLGLATVYGIMDQHGGVIRAYSEPGRGTTFKVYFPVVERRATDVGTKIEGAAEGGSETILLAEDDVEVRELAQAILERAGYAVLTAADGEEALHVFRRRASEIDLVILDVVMPRLGGREAWERMRELEPGVPALFASGYSENAVHTNFVLDAGLSLIRKPFARDQLLRAVRLVLDGGGTRRPPAGA